MRLPQLKLITAESIPGMPSWFRPFLSQLNQFLSVVYDSLNKGLTFHENVNSLTRELTFATSASYASGDFPVIRFRSELGRKAIGVILLQLNEAAPNNERVIIGALGSPNWEEDNQGIRVKYIGGLEHSKKYTARFLVV